MRSLLELAVVFIPFRELAPIPGYENRSLTVDPRGGASTRASELFLNRVIANRAEMLTAAHRQVDAGRHRGARSMAADFIATHGDELIALESALTDGPPEP